MKKKEIIERYGKEAYKKQLERKRAWDSAHPDEIKTRNAAWNILHPKEKKAAAAERSRKGGKYYEKKVMYDRSGLRRIKNKTRMKHIYLYAKFKRIIAPESQIHHQWIPGTAKYTGVALVEAKPHQYGIIKSIVILEGKITLFTEKEVIQQW